MRRLYAARLVVRVIHSNGVDVSMDIASTPYHALQVGEGRAEGAGQGLRCFVAKT
jgi:hypothetical protein